MVMSVTRYSTGLTTPTTFAQTIPVGPTGSGQDTLVLGLGIGAVKAGDVAALIAEQQITNDIANSFVILSSKLILTNTATAVAGTNITQFLARRLGQQFAHHDPHVHFATWEFTANVNSAFINLIMRAEGSVTGSLTVPEDAGTLSALVFRNS